MQRELSAKLTEGLFDHGVDVLANAPEITADFVVWNTKNSQTVFGQKGGACFVFCQGSWLVVLRAIKFNDKLGFGAVKVSDMLTQYFLAGKTNGVFLQKIIPKMAFFLCYVVPKVFC